MGVQVWVDFWSTPPPSLSTTLLCADANKFSCFSRDFWFRAPSYRGFYVRRRRLPQNFSFDSDSRFLIHIVRGHAFRARHVFRENRIC